MKRTLSLYFCLAVVPAFAQQPAERAQESLTKGTAARARNDYTAAEKEYLTALKTSDAQDEYTYRSLFFLGLNKHEAANEAAAKGDAATASALRDAAAEYYTRALELKNTSTSATYNLALIDIERGKEDEALALLTRGLQTATTAEPSDATSANISKIAEKLGDLRTDPIEAFDDYNKAARSGKPSASLNGKIVKSLIAAAKADPQRQTALIDLGWQLFLGQHLDDALDAALSAMDSVPPFNDATASEMLTLATATLARKNYDGATFAGSDGFRRLSAMRHLPDALVPRLKSLFALYQGDVKDAGTLSVWRDEGGPPRAYGRPTSLQAIQQVAHGLGYAAQRDHKFDQGERYYRLAIDLDAAHPDPATLRDLATLYYTRNRLPDIQQLLTRFESSLYVEKGDAYEHVDWEHVAEYHRTLGTIYSWVHRDADAKTQFEHEFEAVKLENGKRAEAARTDLLQIDSTVRLQYADTLSALNQPERANSERLTVAEACASSGKLSCVRDAVAHVDRAALKATSDVDSFQKYLDVSVVLQANARTLHDVDLLKSQLALFSSDSNSNVRKQVEESLRKLGYTAVAVENGHGTFQFGKELMSFQLPDTLH